MTGVCVMRLMVCGASGNHACVSFSSLVAELDLVAIFHFVIL